MRKPKTGWIMTNSVDLAKMTPAGGDRPVTDESRAMELRNDILAALQEVMKIQDRATKCGMIINYQIGRNPIGLHMLNDLQILKILTPTSWT